ncbi:hypothetical protein AVEN_175396-1 [Araneus ventricosus]|uniref:Uncharacterized protein n=1 Tax=Araneus ventricosus TaxID=182803 RepID=A0A4Y2HW67_ARAVE|nr:hypothetical protein AVEN_175396-1 [Araneus ventricosus]
MARGRFGELGIIRFCTKKVKEAVEFTYNREDKVERGNTARSTTLKVAKLETGSVRVNFMRPAFHNAFVKDLKSALISEKDPIVY